MSTPATVANQAATLKVTYPKGRKQRATLEAALRSKHA
jgi:hypothetical protein